MNFLKINFKKGHDISFIARQIFLTEGVELIDHPWFIGVQFHPRI